MKTFQRIVKALVFDFAIITMFVLLMIAPALVEDGNILGIIIGTILFIMLYLFCSTYTYEEVREAFGITLIERLVKKMEE